jgi:hypothetical protein
MHALQFHFRDAVAVVVIVAAAGAAVWISH